MRGRTWVSDGCPVLGAGAGAPENPPLHSPSKPTEPRSRAPGMPHRCSSWLCERGHGGREGEAGSGDRMGVGQHLLICITTDTLLDQENGARNNKGGEVVPWGALGGSLSLPPTPHPVTVRGGRQEVRPFPDPQLAPGSSFLRPGGHPIPTSHFLWPRHPRRPALPQSFSGAVSPQPFLPWKLSPWGPSRGSHAPALPTLFSSVWVLLLCQIGHFLGQVPPGSCAKEHSA